MNFLNNKKNYFLITTANEDTWKKDKSVVFLGDWCCLYSRRHIWNDMSKIILPWHFSNRDKIKKDYNYLKTVYEEILIDLTKKLNETHKTCQSLRYWRIIIGPWLSSYIHVIWDRWESIRHFANLRFDCETFVPFKNFSIPIAKNFLNASNFMSHDDEWNYLIFADILLFQNYKNINLIKKDIVFKKSPKTIKKNSLSSLYKFSINVDEILNRLTRFKNYNYLIYRSYFPNNVLLKLFFKLRQIPRLYTEFDADFSEEIENYFIRPKFPERDNGTNFKNFLYKRIFQDMPIAYLEGYKKLHDYCFSLPNAKVIFTANAHHTNEIFKIWSAQQISNGSKLIISSHGGGIKSLMSSFDEHENKICDKKIVWHISLNNNDIKLSPNKLIDFKIKKKNKQITLVGLEHSRYSSGIKSGTDSSLVMNDFNQKINFINLLNIRNKLKLRIRPYPNKGWELKKRYIDLYGEKIISTNKKILQDYEMSSFIICSYPQTTFSEAMHSGIPTIMLYNEDYWELDEVFSELVFELKKSKIVHSQAITAAKHVNDVGDNPQKWWESDETLKARNFFHDMCGKMSSDPINEWVNFFKNINL